MSIKKISRTAFGMFSVIVLNFVLYGDEHDSTAKLNKTVKPHDRLSVNEASWSGVVVIGGITKAEATFHASGGMFKVNTATASPIIGNDPWKREENSPSTVSFSYLLSNPSTPASRKYPTKFGGEFQTGTGGSTSTQTNVPTWEVDSNLFAISEHYYFNTGASAFNNTKYKMTINGKDVKSEGAWNTEESKINGQVVLSNIPTQPAMFDVAEPKSQKMFGHVIATYVFNANKGNRLVSGELVTNKDSLPQLKILPPDIATSKMACEHSSPCGNNMYYGDVW